VGNRVLNALIALELLNRLNNPAAGAVVIVGQRLHPVDTFGLLLDAEPGTWRHIAVPMGAEADTDIVLPRSGRIWHCFKGDILLPQRFSPQEIQNRKAQPFVYGRLANTCWSVRVINDLRLSGGFGRSVGGALIQP
jgi:hypothetical protein